MKKKMVDFEAYRNYFSDPALWAKIKKVAKKSGIKVVYVALILYYLAGDERVPIKERLKIYGALGYFILPADLVPDAVLTLGYADDFAALAWAVYSVSKYVTPDIEARAEAKLREWFGDFDHSQIAGLLPQCCDD